MMNENHPHPQILLIGLGSFFAALAVIFAVKVYHHATRKKVNSKRVSILSLELGVLSAGDFVWGYASLLIVIGLFISLVDLFVRDNSTVFSPLRFIIELIGSGIAGFLISVFFGFPVIIALCAWICLALSWKLRRLEPGEFSRSRRSILIYLLSAAALATIAWSFTVNFSLASLGIALSEMAIPGLAGILLFAILIPGAYLYLNSLSMALKLRDVLQKPSVEEQNA